MKRLRAYLIAGLLVWIPIGVTVVFLGFVTRQLDKSLLLLPSEYRPEAWLGFAIPGIGIVVTLLLLLVTGLLAANIVGRGMVGRWESVLERIPFVRAVYSASKKFAELLFSDSGQAFKKVLLIEYPRKGIYSIAFLTSNGPDEAKHVTGEDVVCAFVPTTPMPASGFLVLVPRKDVVELEMDVDQAIKLIVSVGVVVPEWRRKDLRELSGNTSSNTSSNMSGNSPGPEPGLRSAQD
ncbi:MAG: DUF502 domain-containing protein [Woeseia sp.]